MMLHVSSYTQQATKWPASSHWWSNGRSFVRTSWEADPGRLKCISACHGSLCNGYISQVYPDDMYLSADDFFHMQLSFYIFLQVPLLQYSQLLICHFSVHISLITIPATKATLYLFASWPYLFFTSSFRAIIYIHLSLILHFIEMFISL